MSKADINDLLNSISNGADWTQKIKALAQKYTSWNFLTNLAAAIKVKDGDTGPRDLRGLTLKNISFNACNNFSDTFFEFVKFTDVQFKNCQINTSSFDYSYIIGKKNAEFLSSNMHRSSFKFAKIRNVDFIDCSGKEINLFNCQMLGCKYENIHWIDTKINYEYTLEPFFKFFLISPFLNFSYLNRGTKIKKIIDPPKHPKSNFSRVLNNYNKIENFKNRNPIPAFLLYFTSDYGRNWKRFSFCIIFIWLIFGFIYSGFEIPFPGMTYEKPEILEIISPHFLWDNGEFEQLNELDRKIKKMLNPYYYSLVIITTLGAGNIQPIDWKAQLYCCIESLFGYFFLSILAAAFFIKLREFTFNIE